MNRNDLKIFKPELLGDHDSSGGQRTLNPIDSSKLNELYRPISDIDHAQSAIDIVKAYPGLNTQTTESLLDGHVFISEPPADPLVNTMLVESDALNDASRLTDMREILQSSVTAGELVRKGMPGFLPNQNSFSMDYLTSIETLNNHETRKVYRLRLGQVIAISVEYEGAEDENYPRLTHFAQVIGLYANNNVIFSPAITQKTPEASKSINGNNNCTRLRLVNDADTLTFHGVSKLTAAASGKQLSVTQTNQHLLPVVTNEQIKAGIKIGGSTGQQGIVRKTLSLNANEGQTYQFDTPDLLSGNNIRVDYLPQITYFSGGVEQDSTDAIITTTESQISATLSKKIDVGSSVSVSYISNQQYQDYVSSSPFPLGSKLIRGTLKGSVKLTDGSNEFTNDFRERDDGIYYNDINRAAIIDYSNGQITYEDGYSELTYEGLVSGGESATSTSFILDANNPKINTFYLQVEKVAGGLISASANEQGVISGQGISGTIQSKLVTLAFTLPVKLSTLTYDITDQLQLLPPADIYKLDPLRIPNAGKVDIFNVWHPVAIQHTQHQAIASPANGQTHNVRVNADFVDITDSTGASLWTALDTHYSVDKETGLVILKSDFSGFTGPFILSDTYRELGLVVDKSLASLTLAKSLSREYPQGATVASVQVLGELQARVGPVRDMTAWDNNWAQDGNGASANINAVDYPIEVTNQAAINEEWVLIFYTTTHFRCIGQRVGQIATADILNDFAPINPVTNQPYFAINKSAFGTGWQQGEAIRFQTIAAAKPIMPVRITQVGHSNVTKDRAVLVFAGNES